LASSLIKLAINGYSVGFSDKHVFKTLAQLCLTIFGNNIG